MEEHEDEMPSAKKQRLAEEVVQQKELLQQEKVFLSYTFTLSVVSLEACRIPNVNWILLWRRND